MVVLFHVARCTFSYASYVLREIIDHSGLPTTSVLAFTRSSPGANWFQRFLLPDDDNYHLLHHLLPKVPMSRLREAGQWLKQNCKEYAAADRKSSFVHFVDGDLTGTADFETYFCGDEGLFMQKLHEHGAFGDPDSGEEVARN
jgi:fatty acid desaturase